MGLSIDRDQFDEEEFIRFGQRLTQSLKALEHLVEQPGFGEGPLTIGAELELSIINSQGQAYPINRALLNCGSVAKNVFEDNRGLISVSGKRELPTLLGFFNLVQHENRWCISPFYFFATEP